MSDKIRRWIKIMDITKKLCGCHQKPDRSFFLYGYQFPLCARCTGVYIGYLIAILMLAVGILVPIVLCLSLLVPLVLDGGIQLVFCALSNNTRRVITGIIFGIGFIHMIVNLIVCLI